MPRFCLVRVYPLSAGIRADASRPAGMWGGAVVHGGALTPGGQGSDDRGFLRVLCHEFRTPVASVQALARALTQPSTLLSAEQRVEAARLIADHAQHLSALLDAVGAVAEHLPKAATDVHRTRIRLADWSPEPRTRPGCHSSTSASHRPSRRSRSTCPPYAGSSPTCWRTPGGTEASPSACAPTITRAACGS